MDARTLQLYACLAGCQGRHEDALSLAMHAVRLDPRIPVVHSQIAQAYLYSGDYANALLSAQRLLALRPHLTTAHALVTRILAVSGDWDAALETCHAALAASGNSPASWALLAYIHAGRGNVLEANSILKTIRMEAGGDCFPAYEVSAVHAVLKQEEQALEQLHAACTSRDMKTIHMNYDPRFEMLRSLPAFQRVVAAQTRIM